jgi:hypothetical protein
LEGEVFTLESCYKILSQHEKWAEWDAVTKQKSKEKGVETSGKEVAIVSGSLPNDAASSSPVRPIGRALTIY